MRIDVSGLLSGAIFIAIGAWFAGSALLHLPVGSAQEMGPGYFPLVLAGILIALGLAIAAQGFGKATTLTGAISWRGAAFILPAPILFGLLINGLGMAPTVLITSLITAFASRRMTFSRALTIAAGLTVICVLIFKAGLGVSIPLFGRWLGI